MDTVQEILSRYLDIVKYSDHGMIDINKFAEYLHLPVSEALKEVFDLYDRVSNTLYT